MVLRRASGTRLDGRRGGPAHRGGDVHVQRRILYRIVWTPVEHDGVALIEADAVPMGARAAAEGYQEGLMLGDWG
jgi:hypothetical protein